MMADAFWIALVLLKNDDYRVTEISVERVAMPTKIGGLRGPHSDALRSAAILAGRDVARLRQSKSLREFGEVVAVSERMKLEATVRTYWSLVCPVAYFRHGDAWSRVFAKILIPSDRGRTSRTSSIAMSAVRVINET